MDLKNITHYRCALDYVSHITAEMYEDKEGDFVQLREVEAGVLEDIKGLFNGTIRWKYQCPPERRGAMIALIHLLGTSWERANELSHAVDEEELMEEIAKELGRR